MKTIYLDMDGVIVDFLGGLGTLYGTSHDCYACGDEEGAMGAMCGGHSGTFWKGHGMNASWWASLMPTADAYAIVDTATAAVGADRVVVVTSCSGIGGAYVGKRAWLQRYFPKLEKGLVAASEKWRIGHRDAILIDDRDSVVSEFRKRSGGHGILLPRRWNRNHVIEDSLGYLNKGLDTILRGSVQ